MKMINLILVPLICFQFLACANDNNDMSNNAPINLPAPIPNTDTMKIKITIGTQDFIATLNNNTTATAFKAMLPLTINMSELNGNEKFFYFNTTLPTNAASGGNIQVGDLMLYGDNCLVLFYENFNTSYNYSKLGHMDNPSGLAAVLGSGNITVTFEAN